MVWRVMAGRLRAPDSSSAVWSAECGFESRSWHLLHKIGEVVLSALPARLRTDDTQAYIRMGCKRGNPVSALGVGGNGLWTKIIVAHTLKWPSGKYKDFNKTEKSPKRETESKMLMSSCHHFPWKRRNMIKCCLTNQGSNAWSVVCGVIAVQVKSRRWVIKKIFLCCNRIHFLRHKTNCLLHWGTCDNQQAILNSQTTF